MTAPATKQTIENPNVTPEQAANLSTLRALRESSKILYARNVSDKPISCREKNGMINVDFMLEVGELAIIPKEALHVRGFIKCWQRRELIISDDETMENEFFLDLDGRVSESQRMQDLAKSLLQDNPTSNDIQQVTCLMAHPGGQQIPVLQRVGDTQAGIPPLCDQHKQFAHMFIGSQQPNGSWTFSQVGGVQR